jgi:hypothetical protein
MKMDRVAKDRQEEVVRLEDLVARLAEAVDRVAQACLAEVVRREDQAEVVDQVVPAYQAEGELPVALKAPLVVEAVQVAALVNYCSELFPFSRHLYSTQ